MKKMTIFYKQLDLYFNSAMNHASANTAMKFSAPTYRQSACPLSGAITAGRLSGGNEGIHLFMLHHSGSGLAHVGA